MSSLPEDLYLEILSRVPARSTYVCKCVCKTWFDLISNPSFIKMHLNHTLQKNKPNLMLTTDDSMYNISHDSEFDNQDDVIELEYPFQFESKYSGVSLLGCCNGLVALSYHCNKREKEDEERLRIWNPVTREIKKLPKPPNAVIRPYVGIHAFGYDDQIDDYKLVIVSDDGSSVDVYTLGTNSWKSLPPIPFGFFFVRVPGVLFRGDLHWLGETCGKDVIVSLNISDESFKAIKLPVVAKESKHIFRSVGLLEGCLCVLSNVVGVDGIDIWVMQEYGVQKSWTKRYVISHEVFFNDSRIKEDYLNEPNDYVYFIRLVSSSKNGKILFAIHDTLIIYDPEHRSLRESGVVTQRDLKTRKKEDKEEDEEEDEEEEDEV